eukprot:TRINITY_DN4916_c0_g1_i1.p1 TRINITY_DN4916_c0_g1~~TRINITY_DN4916_c0_g1_i1.p1  ORF type:complete len:1562 (+),score=232.28 TRINITY_DN4916_c0_g1_i1:66-4751(+)
MSDEEREKTRRRVEEIRKRHVDSGVGGRTVRGYGTVAALNRQIGEQLSASDRAAMRRARTQGGAGNTPSEPTTDNTSTQGQSTAPEQVQINPSSHVLPNTSTPTTTPRSEEKTQSSALKRDPPDLDDVEEMLRDAESFVAEEEARLQQQSKKTSPRASAPSPSATQRQPLILADGLVCSTNGHHPAPDTNEVHLLPQTQLPQTQRTHSQLSTEQKEALPHVEVQDPVPNVVARVDAATPEPRVNDLPDSSSDSDGSSNNGTPASSTSPDTSPAESPRAQEVVQQSNTTTVSSPDTSTSDATAVSPSTPKSSAQSPKASTSETSAPSEGAPSPTAWTKIRAPVNSSPSRTSPDGFLAGGRPRPPAGGAGPAYKSSPNILSMSNNSSLQSRSMRVSATKLPPKPGETAASGSAVRGFANKNTNRYSNPVMLPKTTLSASAAAVAQAAQRHTGTVIGTSTVPTAAVGVQAPHVRAEMRDARVSRTISSGDVTSSSDMYRVKFRFKSYVVRTEATGYWNANQTKVTLLALLRENYGDLNGLKEVDDYLLKVPGIDYYLTNEAIPFHRVDVFQVCKKSFIPAPLEMVERPPDGLKEDALIKNKIMTELDISNKIYELMTDPVTEKNPLHQILSTRHDETVTFRKRITRIRREAVATDTGEADEQTQFASKYNLKYLPQYRESEPLPLEQPQKITFEATLPIKDQRVSTVSCLFDQPVSEVTAMVWSKFKLKDPSAASSGPEDFILKVTGLLEYMFGEDPLSTYDYIRRCVGKKQKINLSLVPLAQVDLLIPTPQHDSIVDTIICREKQQKEVDNSAVKTIEELSQHLRIKIAGIENVDIYNQRYEKELEESKGKEKGKDKEKKDRRKMFCLYVVATVTFGDKVIGEPMYTGAKLYSNNPTWAEWIISDMKLHNIPPGARLCYTLYRRQYDAAQSADIFSERGTVGFNQRRDTPLGWVNCQFVDHKGALLQGPASFKMWFGPGNPIGTCVENVAETDPKPPVLHVEFQTYGFEVIVPPFMPSDTKSSVRLVGNKGQRKQAKQHLKSIMKIDSLTPLSPDDMNVIWENREYCTKHTALLPRFLQCVPWDDRERAQEAHRLLGLWKKPSPLQSLQLLDAKYASPIVRSYAVDRLFELDDRGLADFLLQLTQVLKYEAYHDSPLAQFLLVRALRNNNRIGHAFFWHLKSELHNPTIASRYSLLLESYLRGCGEHRSELLKQNRVLASLTRVANAVKVARPEERRKVLHAELEKIQFPAKFQLPLDPRQEVGGLLVPKCKVMDSKKLPVWLVFENVEERGKPINVIYKVGDDLRQDVLTLQMIRIMDKLWKSEGLDLRLNAYGCVSTGDGLGMIEVVMDAATTAGINKEAGGSKAVLYKDTLNKWLRKHNPSEVEYEKARETFMLSCAGYCVATFVLGIGDRHNDNIMMTKFGHLFHIDFGHFLGNYKSKYGYKRERAPFIFHSQFATILGSKKDKTRSFLYPQFVEICGKAYNILRKHANMFINLFMMMLSTGIPELQREEDIEYLRDSFALGKSNKEAAAHFSALIEQAKKTKTVLVNDMIHILVHSDK